MTSWLEKNILLDRPEYVKQPEGILTDLLWRSPGSSLGAQNQLGKLHGLTFQGQPMERLVFQSITGKALPFETRSLLEHTQQVSIFNNTTRENPYLPIIGSLAAPRARGSKSGACVPIDPNLVILQTLHGLANKKAPPNMADVVETAAWHGGALGIGEAASSFLLPFNSSQATGGLSRLMTLVAPLFAETAWKSYPSVSDSAPATWPPAPLVNSHVLSPRPYKSPLSLHPTPYGWFWKYWTRLCDVKAGWFDVLPSRRWIDWALCLLRTSLALSYVWEAQLLYKIELAAREHAGGARSISWSSLTRFLSGDYVLAKFEEPSLPASQKNCAQAIRQILQDGQAARELLKEEFNKMVQANVVQSADFLGEIDKWLNAAGIPGAGQPTLGPRDAFEELPKNTYEFIRYTLLQRPSDDDTWDQADFYYLARADKSRKYFWFEPGPEWLVVAVSLCTGKPHGTCTLRELRNDFKLLGISVDRGVLVKMLENYGLSTDSPDADDALVIQSGF